MYDAIRKGFAQARGDYLAWLNADEQYQPGALKLVRRTFEETNADIVVGRAMTVRPDGEPIRLLDPKPLRYGYVRAHVLHSLSAATFFHRRLLDFGDLDFDHRFRASADLELMLRLLSSGARVAYVDQVLAAFAIHDDNLSRTQLALNESEQIRQAYGSGGRIIQTMMRGARQMEQVLYRRGSGPVAVAWRSTDNELHRYEARIGRRGHCVS